MKLTGWTVVLDVPPETKKCVLVAAPHTSNWDFPYTMVAFKIMKIPIRYTIKKSWLKFPFGILFKSLGAVGIDRSKTAKGQRISYVDQMAEIIQAHDRIAMVVTVEGTRSATDQWKTGFYHTAVKANVPICLGYMDCEKKIIQIAKALYPSGNMEADMKQIMCFYKDIPGKFPENFKLDHRYPCDQ